METILTDSEAESIFDNLAEKTREELKRDRIRFGEFFVGTNNGKYYRVNPINVIVKDGKPKLLNPDPETEI